VSTGTICGGWRGEHRYTMRCGLTRLCHRDDWQRRHQRRGGGSFRKSTHTDIGRAHVTYLQGGHSHRRADSVRRFNVSRVLVLNRPISVYRFPRRAPTLCPQLCMGTPGARFPALSTDALSAALYGHFTQAIYGHRPIQRQSGACSQHPLPAGSVGAWNVRVSSSAMLISPNPPIGPKRSRSPRHRLPHKSTNDGSKRVSTRGEQYLAGLACPAGR